jgi:glycosyltransferase involved in cell wall biosynthesis
MNLIVVPSNHTKETLERSGALTTPITVIPESFPDSILSESNNFNLDLRTNFNFLIFGQITGNNAYTDRKNTFFALKWLVEAFEGDPDVGIVIKTNHGRNTSIDRLMVKRMLKTITGELKTSVPIYLLHGAMTDGEIAGLYKNDLIKALIAPTRGEGYGLPLLEAAASGLPVLATNWSGHKDFLDTGKWIGFDYEMVDVPPGKIDDQIFLKSARWAEVNEEDFKTKVRKFRERNQKPNEWAEGLSKGLKKTHCFSAIASIWSENMLKYLG